MRPKGYKKLKFQSLRNHQTYAELRQNHIKTEWLNNKILTSKIAFFGPSGAGKTFILYRLINRPREGVIKPTIGANSYSLKKHKINLNIVDIGGQAEFKSYWNKYLSSAEHIALTFNAYNLESLQALQPYIEEAKKSAPNATITLVNNQYSPSIHGGELISEDEIQKFIKINRISNYKRILDNKVDHLKDHLVRTAQENMRTHVESPEIMKKKEAAKEHIENFRDLATHEDGGIAITIERLCFILDNALVSSDPYYHIIQNHDLIQEYLVKLQYSKSSLLTSAFNVISVVLIACAMVTTLGMAYIWLENFLKENHEKKGSIFMFSASGEKQHAETLIHRTKTYDEHSKNVSKRIHQTYSELKAIAQETKKPRVDEWVSQPIYIFGPPGVGKTHLAHQLLDMKSKNHTDAESGGTTIFSQNIGHTKLEINDINGNKKYSRLWPIYLKFFNPCALPSQVLLTFNAYEPESLNELDAYLKIIKTEVPNAKITLVNTNYQHSIHQLSISNEKIQTFMSKHQLNAYYDLKKDNIAPLKEMLLTAARATPPVPEESSVILQKKEEAKELIELFHDRAESEKASVSNTMLEVCKILDEALISDHPGQYFVAHEDALQKCLQKLQFSKASLLSSAFNVIGTTLVACALLSTLGAAHLLLGSFLKKNYAEKGSHFLFSTQGQKQQAETLLHQSKTHTESRKK